MYIIKSPIRLSGFVTLVTTLKEKIMSDFKLGEKVALKATPYRAMRVDAINEDGTYSCSYPVSRTKRDIAKYDGSLLLKYKEPPRVIRLVNKRNLW